MSNQLDQCLDEDYEYSTFSNVTNELIQAIDTFAEIKVNTETPEAKFNKKFGLFKGLENYISNLENLDNNEVGEAIDSLIRINKYRIQLTKARRNYRQETSKMSNPVIEANIESLDLAIQLLTFCQCETYSRIKLIESTTNSNVIIRNEKRKNTTSLGFVQAWLLNKFYLQHTHKSKEVNNIRYQLLFEVLDNKIGLQENLFCHIWAREDKEYGLKMFINSAPYIYYNKGGRTVMNTSLQANQLKPLIKFAIDDTLLPDTREKLYEIRRTILIEVIRNTPMLADSLSPAET